MPHTDTNALAGPPLGLLGSADLSLPSVTGSRNQSGLPTGRECLAAADCVCAARPHRNSSRCPDSSEAPSRSLPQFLRYPPAFASSFFPPPPHPPSSSAIARDEPAHNSPSTHGHTNPRRTSHDFPPRAARFDPESAPGEETKESESSSAGSRSERAFAPPRPARQRAFAKGSPQPEPRQPLRRSSASANSLEDVPSTSLPSSPPENPHRLRPSPQPRSKND